MIKEGPNMKLLKLLFVLFCLLAFAWAFSQPIHAQSVQPVSTSSQISAAAVGSLPFRMLIERSCPLYADRLLNSRIADIPAGDQVMVLEKYEMHSGSGLAVLRVIYVNKKGKEFTGWVYGTLHVHHPL
jgi:hypothetical protein